MLSWRTSIKMFWWRRESRKQRLLRRLGFAVGELRNNFGDELGPLLVSRLSGRTVRHSRAPGKLLTVGSIFFALRRGDTVWGSGLIHEEDVQRAREAQQFRLLAVRGPKTRAALIRAGFDCPAVYGDPALLLPHVFDFSVAERRGIGFVPHWTQLARFRAQLATAQPGLPVKLIDVTAGCHDVLRAIASCEYIVSSSLHGVIVADALGIPAIPVVFEKPLHNDPFKFEDYMSSTDREYEPVPLSFPLDLNVLVARAEAMRKPRIDLLPLLRAFPFRRFSSFEELERRSVDTLLEPEVSAV